MKNVRITVRNYRCFDEANPLRLEIGPGFTAFVGPNNSGKSSALRLFYELRNLWQAIAGNLAGTNESFSVGVNYYGVTDNEEVFSDTNEHPLRLEIEVLGLENVGAVTVNGLHCICDRAGRQQWMVKHTSIGTGEPSSTFDDGTHNPYRHHKLNNNGVNVLHDCAPIVEALNSLANSQYIGPFRNAINEGAGNYFDLAIGTAFVTTWNGWKTGSSKAQNRVIEAVTDTIRRIFEYERLEIKGVSAILCKRVIV